jgi:hypothetical protein
VEFPPDYVLYSSEEEKALRFFLSTTSRPLPLDYFASLHPPPVIKCMEANNDSAVEDLSCDDSVYSDDSADSSDDDSSKESPILTGREVRGILECAGGPSLVSAVKASLDELMPDPEDRVLTPVESRRAACSQAWQRHQDSILTGLKASGTDYSLTEKQFIHWAAIYWNGRRHRWRRLAPSGEDLNAIKRINQANEFIVMPCIEFAARSDALLYEDVEMAKKLASFLLGDSSAFAQLGLTRIVTGQSSLFSLQFDFRWAPRNSSIQGSAQAQRPTAARSIGFRQAQSYPTVSPETYSGAAMEKWMGSAGVEYKAFTPISEAGIKVMFQSCNPIRPITHTNDYMADMAGEANFGPNAIIWQIYDHFDFTAINQWRTEMRDPDPQIRANARMDSNPLLLSALTQANSNYKLLYRLLMLQDRIILGCQWLEAFRIGLERVARQIDISEEKRVSQDEIHVRVQAAGAIVKRLKEGYQCHYELNSRNPLFPQHRTIRYLVHHHPHFDKRRTIGEWHSTVGSYATFIEGVDELNRTIPICNCCHRLMHFITESIRR